MIRLNSPRRSHDGSGASAMFHFDISSIFRILKAMDPSSTALPCQGHSRWIFAIRLAASIAAAALSLWIGRSIYLRQPVTTDENGYIFQANTFSELKLRRPVPEPTEIFRRRMLIMDERTGWIARYPPGHALWLTPAVWLGDAHLASALAAGLSVWFLTGCAVMLGSPAWATALLLLLCPYFLFMHGTLLSHTSGMAAVALMLWGYMRWRLRGRLDGAVIAGLAWGIFFLNRTYTAGLVAMPFALDALYTLWRSPGRRQWLGTILFAGCAATGIFAYLAYNHLITGSAFIPPYIFYGDDMLPGFGGPMRHTWGAGFKNLAANALLLDRWLLLGGGSLLIFGALALVGWDRRWTPLAIVGIVIVPAGYLLFAHPGVNTCGPFYYFEIMPFLVLVWMLAARKLFSHPRAALRRAALWLALAGLAAAAVFSYRFMWREGGKIFNEVSARARLERVLQKAPANSAVIVENMDPDVITDFLVFNPRGLESDPLLFIGFGDFNPLITRGLTNRTLFYLRPDNSERLVPITNRLAFAHSIPWYDIPNRTGRSTGPGEANGNGRMASYPADKPGYLAMGNYMTLPPGKFTAGFDLEITAAGATGAVAAVEISADHGRQILARKEIKGPHSRSNFCLPIEVNRFTEIEPRVIFNEGEVIFRGFSIADRE